MTIKTMAMQFQLQHKTLIHSALSLALVLKLLNLGMLPASAKNNDTLNLQAQDLAILSSSVAQVGSPSAVPCPLSTTLNPVSQIPVQVASTNPDLLIAQSTSPGGSNGGSCPADFTGIPCGAGSEIFCEVGGLTDGPVGGGALAPLALAGGGFPAAALLPLAGIPAAFLGGGGGGGPAPPPPQEPIPEPSMIPGVALALGFLYWQRRRRSSQDLAAK